LLGAAPFFASCKARATGDEDEPGLKSIEDTLDGIIARAREGRLSIDKVLERARQNELVDTRSANLPCEVLDDLLRVDRSASASADATIKDLKRSLAKLRPPNDPDEQLQQSRARASIEEVERMKARIDKQVASMVSQEEAQGCVDSFATYDRSAVLERAKRQTLSPERAIQRAKSDQLVTLRGAEVGWYAPRASHAPSAVQF
jgi:hypothetical protein